jgi:epoxide hydrolase-like protein
MSVTVENPTDAQAIRPFTIPVVPDSELDALRARVTATRWPDKELARYWANDHDWRRCEAKLRTLPHFMTTIDELDRGCHFAAWQEPALFTDELRADFRPMR